MKYQYRTHVVIHVHVGACTYISTGRECAFISELHLITSSADGRGQGVIVYYVYITVVRLCVRSSGGLAEVAWPRLFGHHYEPKATRTVSQRAPAPTLLTCSMGGSVDMWGKSKMDTSTYTCWPVVGDPVRKRSLLLALAVGDDCKTVFCWSETASTVTATIPKSFGSWLIDG